MSWVTIELLRVLNYSKRELDEVEIEVDHFVKLLEMVKSGKITELQGKQILNKFIPKSFDPSETRGKIESKGELKKIVEKVIKTKENSKAVGDYKAGDEKAFNFLMGAVMRATDRRADYKIARSVLEEALMR